VQSTTNTDSKQNDNRSDNKYVVHSWSVSVQLTFSLEILQAEYTPLNGIFSWTTWVSWYEKGKTSLDLNEARDDGDLGCCGISWTTCKQSAPPSRQITTPTPHHSIFTGWMLFWTTNQQCPSTEGTVYGIK